MAWQTSASLFSLTGYLQLQKRNNYLFKPAFKRYWFWFDEQTCSLKYYRNQETYRKGVHEPIGKIDLQYAKVTPGIASGSDSNNMFHINVNEQTYVLAAVSGEEALKWISNLQGKRGAYIKASVMMEETALEQERDRKSLKPNRPVGALASQDASPLTVRNIVHSKINSQRSLGISTSPGTLDCVPRRSATIDPIAQGDHASFKPVATTPEIEDVIFTEEENDETGIPLKPEHRRILELESQCLNYQTKVDTLQKEVLQLKGHAEKKEKTIIELNDELCSLKEQMAKMKKPHHELRSEIQSLKNIIEQYKGSMRSLDKEIELHKLNQKEHEKRIAMEKQRLVEMERELNAVKSKYIKLLSTQFRIHINPSGGHMETVDDLELTKYTNELLSLVEQEGGDNPTFYRGSFEDQYGDIHDWQTGVVTHHYLCRQLYLHYNQQEVESHAHDWKEYISQIKRTHKPYLDLLGSREKTKKELRGLLRKGIPINYRGMVWTSLVYRHVGRLKDLRDSTADGGSYYWSLVRSNTKSDMEKQIKIDLHRTLPNNRHFKINGAGISKLENVLLAYSLHNKNIGYCQGMNMVAALGLLHLEEETVFWYLVAIIEKIMPSNYYTPGLIGAQADQLVLKDLIVDKLPHLQTHLDSHCIDVTFVTLNWFLTLFVDSMPTESALRIMDCFLLEGMKFIFRTSLAILRLNQNLILKKNDPFVLFQIVKELAKNIFDIETLYQEFDKLNPFPSRVNLSNRHHTHLVKVKEQWQAREKEKVEKERKRVEVQVLVTSFAAKEPVQAVQQRLVWECGCVRGEEVWLCGGDGKLGVVSAQETLTLTLPPNSQMASRAICSHYLLLQDLILIGTLDFNLTVIDCASKSTKWRYTMSDSILAITASHNGTIFAALADGFIAMIQDMSAPEPLFLRIGSTSVSSVILAGPEQRCLWCGCGKSITVMCTETLEPVESLVMADGQGSVNKLANSEVGVWVSFRSSSILSLYDMKHFVPLLTMDYCTILPAQPEHQQKYLKSNHRITSLMIDEDKVWVGTGGGRVFIFSYSLNVPNMEEAIHNLISSRTATTESKTTPSSSDGGLLVTVSTERKESTEIPEEEQWVEVEDKKSSLPSHYEKRRKTAFGKTLRNKSKQLNRCQDLPDVYQLKMEFCSDIITAPNDSVRVLLPLQDSENRYTVSCVNTVKTDWNKGVQAWTCPRDKTHQQWSFTYLFPLEVVPPISPPPSSGEVGEVEGDQENANI